MKTIEERAKLYASKRRSMKTEMSEGTYARIRLAHQQGQTEMFTAICEYLRDSALRASVAPGYQPHEKLGHIWADLLEQKFGQDGGSDV